MATIISIPILEFISTNSVRPVRTYKNNVSTTLYIMTHLITDVTEKRVSVDGVQMEKVSIVYKKYMLPELGGKNYHLKEVVPV